MYLSQPPTGRTPQRVDPGLPTTSLTRQARYVPTARRPPLVCGHEAAPCPVEAMEVYTDWVLIRRLAWELQSLRGARIRDAGLLADGRFALDIRSRGKTVLLCADLFAPSPVLTLEEGELSVTREPRFARTAAVALRAKTIGNVQSREGDRLLRLDLVGRSAFGIEDAYALVYELVPRFGNVVLLKGQTIVAAAKEFSPADNGSRSVQAGGAYALPPARPAGRYPLLPPLVLESLRHERLFAEDLARRAQAFVDAYSAEAFPPGELYAYRENGTLVQAHVVPLAQLGHLPCERAPSLIALFSEDRLADVDAGPERAQKRRRDVQRALEARKTKLRGHLEETMRRLEQAQGRQVLRARGEQIYAALHEIAPDERNAAKARAAEAFGEYKRAAASLPHLRRRADTLRRALEETEELLWEAQRAQEDDLEELEALLAPQDPARPRAQRRARRRPPLQYQTASGSRIIVGRSPLENADLTFRIARPNDLWFHAQNQPGAHVILQRDDRAAPPDADIEAAAALAALHSKGKDSAKVTVDYTQRKHVRKRPAAAPGLVFYTEPRSIVVTPAEP